MGRDYRSDLSPATEMSAENHQWQTPAVGHRANAYRRGRLVLMSRNAYIIGAYSTEFRKWPNRTFKDLSRDACCGVLEDAGVDRRPEIDSIWFANSGMCAWGQSSIRGQVCLAP